MKRRRFAIYYTNGFVRTGTIYAQSNIMMDDGELFARLDQLITDNVVCIVCGDNHRDLDLHYPKDEIEFSDLIIG